MCTVTIIIDSSLLLAGGPWGNTWPDMAWHGLTEMECGKRTRKSILLTSDYLDYKPSHTDGCEVWTTTYTSTSTGTCVEGGDMGGRIL